MSTQKNLLLCVSICFLFASCDSVQPQEANKINYPHPVPDSTALVFLPGIVSTDSIDFNAAFSMDGKTYYFTRKVTGKELIMESRYDSGRWTAPVVSPLFDTMYTNADVFISDKDDIYFISKRPASAADTTNEFDIYRMLKQDGKYGRAEPLTDVNSDSTEYYVSVAKNGNIYFSSYRDGNLDLYWSELKDGKYQKPVSLGPVVNSSVADHDPLIAPDESYLIFASDRIKREDADLYISFRNGKEWLTPKHMGSRFNTATYEYCPNLSPDGKYFFFTSERDVKWISASVLERYR